MWSLVGGSVVYIKEVLGEIGLSFHQTATSLNSVQGRLWVVTFHSPVFFFFIVSIILSLIMVYRPTQHFSFGCSDVRDMKHLKILQCTSLGTGGPFLSCEFKEVNVCTTFMTIYPCLVNSL